MNLRLSGWMSSAVLVLAVVLAGCAGGGSGAPSEGGVCRIVWREDGSEVELAMPEDGSFVRVTGGGDVDQTHHFDAERRLVRTSYETTPQRPSTDYTYDAQGHLISAITFGTPDITQCTNSYDDQDRLTRHTCTNSDQGFRYDSSDRIDQVTTFLSDNATRVADVSYDADGQITLLEDETSAYSYTYDDNGRMTSRERDWVFGSGKDGTADVRWSWLARDDSPASGIAAYEQDGTDHADNPFIDGEADLRWTFSPGCDAIGALHPWIYNQYPIINVGVAHPRFPF